MTELHPAEQRMRDAMARIILTHIPYFPALAQRCADDLIAYWRSTVPVKLDVNNHDALTTALKATQEVLSTLLSNEKVSSVHIWTQAVAAETGARIALASVTQAESGGAA